MPALLYEEFLGDEYVGPVGTDVVEIFTGAGLVSSRSGILFACCGEDGEYIYVHTAPSVVSATRYRWRIPAGRTKFLELPGDQRCFIKGSAAGIDVSAQQVLVT